ncbi:unnamed protein product [Gongylonema pulchrum]|uniref:RING-type domain-containing protein n=1 Tax=Gongylonema pulchrum TaxID=637853 RepID=A0A183E203_9BILA|nr:unnamed protein product [Gongylonema pulchrum]
MALLTSTFSPSTVHASRALEHRYKNVVCLKCGHLFGQSCIERWIRRNTKNASCPQCKERARLTDIRRLYTSIVKVREKPYIASC